MIDIEKIIEKLQVESDKANDRIMDSDTEVEYWDGYEDGLDRAIEIIKDGG